MKFSDITEVIIGCAYRVYNTMGFGYLESIYQKCLTIELQANDLDVVEQFPLSVTYRDVVVGDFIADFLVAHQVLVEIKSVRVLQTAHEMQLVNYLIATGKEVGLLINFGEKTVDIKRKVRQLNQHYPQS